MKILLHSIIIGSFIAASAYASPAGPAAVVSSSPPPALSAHPSSGNKPALTPSDWQELRMAHQKALQADPGLVKKASALTDRMRAFQAKLNAAMIKDDPKIAPIIAKLQGFRVASAQIPSSAASHP